MSIEDPPKVCRTRVKRPFNVRRTFIKRPSHIHQMPIKCPSNIPQLPIKIVHQASHRMRIRTWLSYPSKKSIKRPSNIHKCPIKCSSINHHTPSTVHQMAIKHPSNECLVAIKPSRSRLEASHGSSSTDLRCSFRLSKEAGLGRRVRAPGHTDSSGGPICGLSLSR